MELKGKKTVITGCTSGIGLELLKLLLVNDCTVVACARSIDRLELPAGIPTDKLYKLKTDVSDKDELDALFTFAAEKLGSIDLFIANAGFAYYEKIAGPDWEHIEKIYKTNVMSFIYCAEKMKALHGDAPYNFVVTGSSMGFLSMPGYSLYSGTKAAVRGFADAYRLELAPGQHFQVVYPIATKTKFFSNAGSDTPVPWPTQSSETVARKIVNGIKRDKKHIYPSATFRIMSIVNRVLPFLFKIYVAINNKAYQKWLATQPAKAEGDK
ncbi:MAG: SDR family NAD(P)-dependent oxidoreductase [Treponema sp.]|nr:SDR family NAD(P)-dependent oxidoreductase [Candidatus Treponema caballi]